MYMYILNATFKKNHFWSVHLCPNSLFSWHWKYYQKCYKSCYQKCQIFSFYIQRKCLIITGCQIQSQLCITFFFKSFFRSGKKLITYTLLSFKNIKKLQKCFTNAQVEDFGSEQTRALKPFER